MTSGYFDKLRMLEQAYEDLSILESAGLSAFGSEEEYFDELDGIKGAIYTLEEMLSGSKLK